MAKQFTELLADVVEPLLLLLEKILKGKFPAYNVIPTEDNRSGRSHETCGEIFIRFYGNAGYSFRFNCLKIPSCLLEDIGESLIRLTV